MKSKLSLLAVLSAVTTSSPAALVAQFSFETDLSNSVIGGATASVIGSTTPTAGTTALGPGAPVTGNVLELNGGSTTPDGVRIGINLGQGSNTSLSSLGDNFSIAAWYRIDNSPVVNSDGANGRHFVWEGDNSYDVSYNGRPSSGNGQSFTQGPDANTLIANAATAGTWFHVVQTYATSGTNISITTYVNGLAGGTVLSSANTNVGDFNVVNLNIGVHRDEGRAFDGQIDEVMIWDNTLSAGDVTTLYNSQVPEPSAALLGGLGVLALLRRRRA